WRSDTTVSASGSELRGSGMGRRGPMSDRAGVSGRSPEWSRGSGRSPECSRGSGRNPECSLTIEYPANGSFSDHTHAVCMKLTQATLSNLKLLRTVGVGSEFLMVKLLRVYGECLGARSR